MIHPFSEDTANMSVSDIHEKLAELSKKYFQTQNPQVREQLQTFIEFFVSIQVNERTGKERRKKRKR